MPVEFFDIATAPSAPATRKAIDALGGPDRAGLNVYLGGHRCVGSGWTAERIGSYVDAGVRLFLLTYVGDQKSDQLGEIRGESQGRDAAALATALGWTRGAPVVIDIEAHTYEAKPDASMDFVAGWCREVRAAGHRAGIYSSVSGLKGAWGLGADAPDFAWAARWLGHERTSADPRKVPQLGAARWPSKGTRAWQYAGELREGTTRLRCRLANLDVDLDVADDGLLVGPPGERPRLEALVAGQRSADIRLLQIRLRTVDAGVFAVLNPSGASGRYGPETTAMCRAFQQAQGWTGRRADGQVGPITLSRLFP